MKRFISISSLFFMLISFDTAAQKHYNFKLSRVNYFEDSTRVGISFKIKNAKDFDRFDLDVSAFDEKQNSLTVNSLSNHLALEKDKFHTVYWNAINDGYKLDGSYNLKLNLSRGSAIKIPYNKHFILSALFPGLGDYKIRNGWWHGLYGILAYGATYYAIDLNEKANRNYILYRNSYDVEQSNNFFESSRKQANLSRILAVTAGVTWVADLGLMLNRIKRVKRDMSRSKFYQKKQDRIYQWGRDKYYYLNTKKKYERFYDSAIVSFDKQDYIQSRIYLDQAKSSNKSDTEMLKLINAYSDTVNLEIDYASYYRSGKLNLDKLELTKAKASLDKANKLKPKQDSVVRKIDSISSYFNYLSIGDSMYIIKNYDKALMNYRLAKRYYETTTLKSKIKLVNNNINYINYVSIGDDYFKNKFYLRAEQEYKKALKIFPNKTDLKAKLDNVKKIIQKINKDNTLYAKLINEAKNFVGKEDYDNALIKYKEALKYKPNDPVATNSIGEINDYKVYIKKGDQSKAKKIYKAALGYYTQAKSIFSSYLVRSKIREVENFLRWDDLVDEGKRLKVNAENHKKNKDLNKALETYKKSLEKFKEAKSIRVEGIITYNLAKIESEISQLNSKLNKGKAIVTNVWYEIYNQNGLKLEIMFEIPDSPCKTNWDVIYYSYKYSGIVKDQNTQKYVYWELDYTNCNTSSPYKYYQSVPIGGADFKSQNIGTIFNTPREVMADGEIKAKEKNIFLDISKVEVVNFYKGGNDPK